MKLKVLIITYYWPPSGGSGVQRWLYFAKYLSDFGIEPFVITVDEKFASYKFIDNSLSDKIAHVKVFKTKTRELLKFYSKITSGDVRKNVPMGFAGEDHPGFFQRISRFIRGNFFIPDARIGWNNFAFKKAKEIILKNEIGLVITSGPPHSTHLVGLQLKNELGIKWIADLRDPWTEVYYNKLMYRSKRANKKDEKLESDVLKNADLVLTIGPSMKKLLEQKAGLGKTEFIYNGYDSEVFRFLKRDNDPSYFTICHVGILSESQPVTAFLDALAELKNAGDAVCGKMKLQFIGKVSPAILVETKNKIPWIKIETKDYVPHTQALTYMMNADLLFNSLVEMAGSELLVSGKLMEYIASGNPIVCLGNPNGDAAKLLSELDHAKVFSRGSGKEITEFIRQIVKTDASKNKPVKVNHEKYSRYETTRELAALIKKMI